MCRKSRLSGCFSSGTIQRAPSETLARVQTQVPSKTDCLLRKKVFTDTRARDHANAGAAQSRLRRVAPKAASLYRRRRRNRAANGRRTDSPVDAPAPPSPFSSANRISSWIAAYLTNVRQAFLFEPRTYSK